MTATNLITLGLQDLNSLILPSVLVGIYFPINALTQRGYNGINRVLLAQSFIKNRFSRNTWATFLQSKSLGLEVKENQSPTKIVYWTTCQQSRKMTCEVAALYNIDQLIGDTNIDIKTPHPNGDRLSESREFLLMLSHFDVEIEESKFGAAYQMQSDKVYISSKAAFNYDIDAYYTQILEQVIHCTKHPKRLNRNYISQYSASLQDTIACEALVIFLAKRFICDALGCKVIDNETPIYQSCWTNLIKDNPKLILKVAADAQKAAEFILEHSIIGFEIENTQTAACTNNANCHHTSV